MKITKSRISALIRRVLLESKEFKLEQAARQFVNIADGKIVGVHEDYEKACEIASGNGGNVELAEQKSFVFQKIHGGDDKTYQVCECDPG